MYTPAAALQRSGFSCLSARAQQLQCQHALPNPACLRPSRRHNPVVVSAALLGGFGKKAAGSSGKAAPCPCGSGKKYQDCCQKFHQSRLNVTAGDPETLLRARYCAWVKGAVPYLRKSCHPDNPCLKGSDTAPDAGVTRHCSFEEDVAVTLASVRFEKLEVLRTCADDEEPEGRAYVEYACTFKRLIGNDGQKLKAPVTETIKEKAVLVKDEDKGWLLLEAAALAS